ncbi:MAG: hypothetical protein ACK5ME_03540 [Parahaliea sp.]
MDADFGCGVLTPVAVGLTSLPLFAMTSQSEWLQGAVDNWVLLALIAFPEGFMTFPKVL